MDAKRGAMPPPDSITLMRLITGFPWGLFNFNWKDFTSGFAARGCAVLCFLEMTIPESTGWISMSTHLSHSGAVSPMGECALISPPATMTLPTMFGRSLQISSILKSPKGDHILAPAR